MTVSKRTNQTLLFFILAIATSFAPLSMDFLAPSLPNVTRDLGGSVSAVQNTLYVFFIGYGISPFVWGILADRYGRRLTMLAGITLYCIATLGCLFSKGISELLVLRFLQGIGAASGVVVARATLRDIYGPDGTTKAIANMFLIMVWVPILAPLFGGYIATELSWRFSFFVMVLFAGATLLGSYLYQEETLPEKLPHEQGQKGNWQSVLSNKEFTKHALANMFCISTMLLFIANFSYIAEQYYQFSPVENGRVLAGFNASLAVGVYMVHLFVPKIGIDKTISLGLRLALAGWVSLWVICLIATPEPLLLVAPLLFACLGTGIVISLTAGQALVPFTYTAGVASALFICVQSAGSSFLNVFATMIVGNTLTSITSLLVMCSILAMVSMNFRYKETKQ